MKGVQTVLILPLLLMSCGSIDFLPSTEPVAAETEIKPPETTQTAVNSQFVEFLLLVLRFGCLPPFTLSHFLRFVCV